MKVLSLKQPFVERILAGTKSIELRSWNTQFRGRFLLHASLQQKKDAMKLFGYETLPVGYILGEVNLSEVRRYTTKEEFEKDRHLHQSTSQFSKEIYGFVLTNPKRIAPIPAKGKLGFWDLNNEK